MARNLTQVVFSTADIAALLGWKVERARDWVQREGIGFQMGKRWFTTPQRIRDAFPDVYQALRGKIEEPG